MELKNYEDEEFNTDYGNEHYTDVPRPGKKWERKPYPTPIKELIRRAKKEKKARMDDPCRVLQHPPDNGLLVPELIDVAHQVYHAHNFLQFGLSKLVDGVSAIPVQKCRFCPEVHIGHQGHEIKSCEGQESGSRNSFHVWKKGLVRDVVGFPFCYHLVDRAVKPRIGHKERFGVSRLPAILELCIQAGVDLDNYPTKRRDKPVYSVEGRIVDFDPQNEEECENETRKRYHSQIVFEQYEDSTMPELSTQTLQAWFDMMLGAIKIMKKYSVLTCGYCPEVQVGPKGHKVRMCKATKHQVRDGQHAWQEATINDLIKPNYVWHERNLDGPPLSNSLKRYYGKAPAIVELCVQAGAPVPERYKSMMRLDVVPPDIDEHDLVA